MNFILSFTFFICLLISESTYGQARRQSVATSSFRAAVVKVDVTPKTPQMLLGYGERESTGVHDRLFHRIVVLDDGVTQFYLVSSDFGVIAMSEYDKVAEQLQRRLGINPLNFWWTLTHTHSAPEIGPPDLLESFMRERFKHEIDTVYASFVETALINGIIEARNKLSPARLGVGWGFSMANMNRRAVDIDGKAVGTVSMNPEGATDRRIGLLRIDYEDGSPMALIANYPIHGTVLGSANLQVSADAPGIVAEYVEEKTGAPMLFINGAAGNLAPIYSVYPNANGAQLKQFRKLLGDKILDANRNIGHTIGSVKLFTGSIMSSTPRKPGMIWPKNLGKYTFTKGDKHFVQIPVRFLRINDNIAIWACSPEIFCEIANEVRDRSPFEYTFHYGYANGWLGYLPTEKEFQYGGYEADHVSPFTPSAEKDLKESVIGYLHGEMKSTNHVKYESKKDKTRSK